MSLTTSYQRMRRAGQPYTRVTPDIRYEEVEVEVEIDGETRKGLRAEHCFSVIGYTYEDELQPTEDTDADPVYKLAWVEHDLGQQPTLEEAHKAAAEWRESLRGVYEVR